MAQNIVVIGMAVVVAFVAGWCWWVENGKDSKKKEELDDKKKKN